MQRLGVTRKKNFRTCDGVFHVGYKMILGEGRILGGGLRRVFHALSPLERGVSSFFLLRS